MSVETLLIQGVERFPRGSLRETRTIALPLAGLLWVIALWLRHADFNSTATGTSTGLGSFFYTILGITLWSFYEYLLHRFVLHLEGNTPFTRALMGRLHLRHHHETKVEWLVFIPTIVHVAMWTTFGIIHFVVGSLLFDWDLPSLALMTAATAVASVLYDLIHFATHFRPARTRVGRMLKKNHLRHHFHDPSKNFGVSSPIWDWVFGTRGQPGRTVEKLNS